MLCKEWRVTVENVILPKTNMTFFQGKLQWGSQFGDGINLVFCKENHSKKIQFLPKNNEEVMRGRLQ